MTGPLAARIPHHKSDYGKVLWGLPDYPYLAFISKTPIFWHYPLNRLAITVDTASLDDYGKVLTERTIFGDEDDSGEGDDESIVSSETSSRSEFLLLSRGWSLPPPAPTTHPKHR
jgi:hypothetical protein